MSRTRAVVAGLILAAAAALLFYRKSTPTPIASTPAPSRSSSYPTPSSTPNAAPPPPAHAAPAAASSRPVRLARLGWGSGKDQVGRRQDPEAAQVGPMAIAAARDGTMYVLDQVQRRVLRRMADGRFADPIAIGTDTVQDLRARPDGFALLDRLGEKTVRRYDTSGQPVEEHALKSVGVVEPGGTTALLVDRSGAMYVEESLAGEGRRVVRPLDGSAPLPGRPTRDARQLITAAIDRSEVGAFVVRGLDHEGHERWSHRYSVGRPILGILLLDSDENGGIYVGVSHAAAPVPPAHDLTDERLAVLRLDADGVEVSRVEVPHPPSPIESFRPLEVAGVGRVWWMHPLPDGSAMVVDELTL